MKKFIIGFLLLGTPTLCFAQGFDVDVYYGMQGPAVQEVQEFLGAHGYFSGPYTGNFYSLTLAAVKRFQAAQGIRTTGYFGPLSRAAAQKLVASEFALDETSTTTDISPAPGTKPSVVFTLPNGSVISISPDGTITTLYSPTGSQAIPQVHATSSTTTPQATLPSMQDSPSQPSGGASQPAPAPVQTKFERTGSVNATLVSKAQSITIGSDRVILFSFQVDNKTNEKILFSGAGNIQAGLKVSNKSESLKDWGATIYGVYMSQALDQDTIGIKPGASGSVAVFLTNPPAVAGSADFLFTGLKVVGDTSGDLIPVDASEFELGVIEVK